MNTKLTVTSVNADVTDEEIEKRLHRAYEDIASQLHIPTERVRAFKKSRRPRMSTEKRKVREDSVLELRLLGYSHQKIAEELVLSKSVVVVTISKLLREGRINRAYSSSFSLENERVKTIISLVKKRVTLEEIGQAIKVTRERVRQIVKKLTEIHGKEIFKVEDPLLKIPETAAMLGVPIARIRKLIDSGDMGSSKRPGSGRETLILTSEVEKNRNHPLITGKRICRICEETFTKFTPTNPNGSGVGTQYCSDGCYKVFCQKRYKTMYQTGPSATKLTGWCKAVFEALQSHTISSNEKWIRRTQAEKTLGGSKMQLTYLIRHKILAARPHATEKWRGRPMNTYAVSELEIAGGIYREYH